MITQIRCINPLRPAFSSTGLCSPGIERQAPTPLGMHRQGAMSPATPPAKDCQNRARALADATWHHEAALLEQRASADYRDQRA